MTSDKKLDKGVFDVLYLQQEIIFCLTWGIVFSLPRKYLNITMIEATGINQQLRDAVSTVFNVDEFERLTARAFGDASVNLEIELREERIAPYLVDITKPLVEVKPLISIGGSPVCSAGNLSAIVGEAKCKKTFLTTALVASAIAYPYPDSEAFENVSNDISLKVLWLDTEQGEAHVRKVIDRINRITGTNRSGGVEDPRLKVFALREIDPKQRLDVLRDALFTFEPNLVVIDGIADLQYDTNDLRESDALIGELMALSTNYNCHILCVLHTNPGTDKARGHVGSSLQRKAETVLYVHKVEDVSVVEPQFCRNEPFERFAFQVNSDGLPELCNLPTETLTKEEEVVAVVRDSFGGSIERKVLVNKLQQTLGLARTTAQMRVSRAIRKGVLLQNDNLVTLSHCNGA